MQPLRSQQMFQSNYPKCTADMRDAISESLTRKPRTQVVILADRICQHILTLIQRLHPANTLHELVQSVQHTSIVRGMENLPSRSDSPPLFGPHYSPNTWRRPDPSP